MTRMDGPLPHSLPVGMQVLDATQILQRVRGPDGGGDVELDLMVYILVDEINTCLRALARDMLKREDLAGAPVDTLERAAVALMMKYEELK